MLSHSNSKFILEKFVLFNQIYVSQVWNNKRKFNTCINFSIVVRIGNFLLYTYKDWNVH